MTLRLVALALCATAIAQGQLPTVEGYRLGATWSAVARSLPCRQEDMWAGVPHVKVCDASDTVHLGFIRDTLFDVVVEGSFQPFSPNTRWNFLRTWSVAVFGTPDSVVNHKSTDREYVVAHWGTCSAQLWAAQLSIGGRSPEPSPDPALRYGFSMPWMRATFCRFAPHVFR